MRASCRQRAERARRHAGREPVLQYFGYSIHQWGALIGVVLSCLTCGYYVGGQVGDRPWARTFLLWALILSAAWILLGPLLNQAREVLFLGVAGGTSLKQLLAVYPEIESLAVRKHG